MRENGKYGVLSICKFRKIVLIGQVLTQSDDRASYIHQLESKDILHSICRPINYTLNVPQQKHKSSAGCCGGGCSQNDYDIFYQYIYAPQQQQQSLQYAEPLLQKQPENNINIKQAMNN